MGLLLGSFIVLDMNENQKYYVNPRVNCASVVENQTNPPPLFFL